MNMQNKGVLMRRNLHLTAIGSIACTLLLSGCTSKKAEFKKQMTAWVKAHPQSGQFCTSFQSGPPNMLSFTPVLGAFTQTANFYEPSPVFSGNKKIFAVTGAVAEPALHEMVKYGLLKAFPVNAVTDSISFRPIAHTNNQTMIHHYKVDHEIFYVLTSKSSGFATQGYTIRPVSISPIHTHHTTPLVLKTEHIESGFGPPQWCGGTARITKINLYTIPASQDGMIMSNVTATAVPVGLPAWLFNPAIDKALNPAPSKTYKATGGFVKTSNGWRLTGGVQIGRLGNGGGF